MTTCFLAAVLVVSQAADSDRYAPPSKPAAEYPDSGTLPKRPVGTFAPKVERTLPGSTAPSTIPPSSGSTFPSRTPDNKIPPAASTPATAPPTKMDSQLIPVRPSSSLAADLLNRSLDLPEDQAISGRSVELAELLAAKESIGGRHVELVSAYWKLSRNIAQYHFSVMEYERLAQVDRGLQTSQLTMDSARAEAAALVQKDKLAVVESQHSLAELMGLAADSSLPLPADRPLVGGYRTYYEALFASGMDSPGKQRLARRLHDTLPIMHQALRTQAAAVQAADDLVIATLIATERGEANHQTVLARHSRLRKQRLEFLSSVLDYNQSIAQYAVIAARPGAQPSDLLPMLIKVKVMTAAPSTPIHTPQATAESPGAVLPATALETEPGQVVQAAEPPATFTPPTFTAPKKKQPTEPTQTPGPEAQQAPRLFNPPTGARQPRPLRSVVVPPRSRP